MALKFLNKKGWHTGSLRNIENVWKAEQKHEAEKRKLEELQKQIKEEQEHLEFRKLQEQAGLVPKQERLDFLYESGLGVGKPSNEEYLLGKPVEESKEANIIQQVSATPGSLFVEEKISANDQWRKIRSDPLLLIKQQELAARERIKSNPLKMEALRKEVELKMKAKEEKKRLKALAKAEEKQKRRALKKEMKKHGDADDHDDEDKHKRRRDAEEDGSYEQEKEDKDRRSAEDDDKERNRNRRVGDEDRRKYDRSRNPDREESRDRSRSAQDDGYRRKRADEEFRSERRNAESDERSRYRTSERDEEEERYKRKRAMEEDDTGTRKRERHDNPDDKPRQEEGTSSKHRDWRSLGRPPLPRKRAPLSEEEKAARLREMQQDAELHEEQRWQRIKKASISDAMQEEKDSIKSSKNFLDETNRSVYGTDGGGNASVADTLHRRSHYREKFTDKNAFRRS